MIKYIFRVENKEGIGPYKGMFNYDTKWADKTHNDNDLQYPTPYTEFNESIQSDEYCAFNSYVQLKNWFSRSEIEKMKSYGYKVRRYRAKITRVGRKQIIIKKLN